MTSTLDTLVAISEQVYDLPNVPNPLAAITQIISREPHTPRTRVLTAILRGLATEKGEFSESDIYALDLEALVLVAVLAQDLLNGRYAKQELLR
jgi:hypothetical protein